MLIINLVYYVVNYHLIFNPALKLLIKMTEKLSSINCLMKCKKKLVKFFKKCYRILRFQKLVGLFKACLVYC